jgi:hypothetical protein
MARGRGDKGKMQTNHSLTQFGTDEEKDIGGEVGMKAEMWVLFFDEERRFEHIFQVKKK